MVRPPIPGAAGRGGRRRLLVSASPDSGTAKARDRGSGSAARWNQPLPHVTGGGTPCSRHRPGGGSRQWGVLGTPWRSRPPRVSMSLVGGKRAHSPPLLPLGVPGLSWRLTLCRPRRAPKGFLFLLPGVLAHLIPPKPLPYFIHPALHPRQNGTGPIRGPGRPYRSLKPKWS